MAFPLTNMLQEYRAKLVTGYLVVVSLIAFLIQGMYREYFEAVVKLVLTEDYSYLLVAFFTVVATLYLSLRYMGFSYEVQLSRVLSAALLSVIATMLYYASKLNLDYSVQLVGLSFAVMVIAAMIFVFKPVSPSDIIPLITPLFAVPVPASVLDRVTTSLSRIVGRVATTLTGTRLVETQAFTMIEIATGDGVHLLSIEAACSGIATLSTVIVIFPLLAYYVTVSRERALKKVAISATALVTGLLIGFLGNALRVASIVLVAKCYSIEVAMSVFHYSPSVIYASLSVIVAYVLISKLAHITRIAPRPLETGTGFSELKWEYVMGILLLLSFLIPIVQVSVMLSEKSLVAEAGDVAIKVSSVNDFIENPVKYLVYNNATVLDYAYDAFLTRIVGSLATYRVSFITDNGTYSGFLELVDTAGRLHTLQLCLSVQGYRVLNAWSEQRGLFRVSYIVSEKDGALYLLAYVLTPITVRSISRDYTFYARMSLIKPYTSAEDVEVTANTLLKTLNVNPVFMSWQNIASGLVAACSLCLITLVIYVLVTYLYNPVSRRGHSVV